MVCDAGFRAFLTPRPGRSQGLRNAGISNAHKNRIALRRTLEHNFRMLAKVCSRQPVVLRQTLPSPLVKLRIIPLHNGLFA